MCTPEYKVKYREVRFIYFQLLIDSFKWQIPYLSRIYSSHIVIYYYKCYNLKIQVWWAFLFFFSFYLLHLILLKPTKVDQNHNLWSFFMIKKHLLIFFSLITILRLHHHPWHELVEEEEKKRWLELFSMAWHIFKSNYGAWFTWSWLRIFF